MEFCVLAQRLTIAAKERARDIVRAALPAVAVVLLSLSAAQGAAGTVVRKIDIQGAQRLDADSIRARLSLRAGAPFDEAAADQSVKALFATGQYQDVDIRESGGTVTVRVTENPVIERVSFEGNSAIAADVLLKETQLRSGEPYSQHKGHADEAKIRELYIGKGRVTTTVSRRVEVRPDGRVHVVFAVAEGPVNKVSAIRFAGATAFSERALKSVIRTSESSWLDVLKQDAFYDPARLEIDRALLLLHYKKNGYADARIVSATGELDGSGNAYIVTFTIDEGPLFTFGPGTIVSEVEGVDVAALSSDVLSAPGAAYDATRLERTETRLTSRLIEQGHRFAVVKAKEAQDRSTGTVIVTYKVEALPQTFVERIEIHGNTRTKDHVIRRELKLAEGDAFHPLLIERANERLKVLGYFKKAVVEAKRGSAADKVAVNVEVVEDETRDLGFGVGFSQNEGVVGDVSLAERNLMGNGQFLKLKLAGSLKRFDAEAGFTEPRFLDSDISAGVDLFYRDTNRRTESSFKSRSVGGDVRFGTALSEHWSGQVKYMLSRNEIYEVGEQASTAIKEAAGDTGSSTAYTSAVGYTLAFDNRDSKRAPTQGTLLTFSQDFAGLGGDVRYIKTSADVRTYVPITDSVSLFNRAAGGMVTGWGGQDVRLLDLFYKGGDLVRGFAPSGLGPRDTASANQDALGGTMYLATSAGAQFGVPFVPRDIGLRAEVFADAGSLFGVNRTAAALPGVAGQQASLRASVGAGLIWDSPIGPLRADYAIPVAKQPFDKTQPFSFGLGQF